MYAWHNMKVQKAREHSGDHEVENDNLNFLMKWMPIYSYSTMQIKQLPTVWMISTNIGNRKNRDDVKLQTLIAPQRKRVKAKQEVKNANYLSEVSRAFIVLDIFWVTANNRPKRINLLSHKRSIITGAQTNDRTEHFTTLENALGNLKQHSE